LLDDATTSVLGTLLNAYNYGTETVGIFK